MVKFTHVPCHASNAPALVLIPGGPGLSSLTLGSLDILNRSFDLHFVDLPGTNGLPYGRDHSLEELSKTINAKVVQLRRPTIMLGHSFGGFFAADVALKVTNVMGLVCIGTPFTGESLRAAGANYDRLKTPALIAAEERWAKAPSDKTFAGWLAEYGELYFAEATQTAGRELLLRDSSSFRLFQSLRQDAARMESLLPRLRDWPRGKLFLAGKEDRLLPMDVLLTDADSGSFDFRPVLGASHFAMFDQPASVAGLIEKYFAAEEVSSI